MDTKGLFGRRVRELRQKRKLTQEKLAELAGVDIGYLGSIERGQENPTLAVLDKIATAFGTTLNQILDFEHTITGPRALKRRIAQLLDGCDERELQQILRLILAIKN